MTALLIIADITPRTTTYMHILFLTDTMPTIVMVMLVSTTPKAECSVIEGVVIHPRIVAMRKVYTIMGPTISMIASRYAKIVVITIRITRINTHSPSAINHINGAIEIITINESAILSASKHIHEVFISHI